MMTKTERQTIKYWLEKICRECDRHNIRYGIFTKSNITVWEENLDRFLSGSYDRLEDIGDGVQCDINIIGFHRGPEGSTFGSTYMEKQCCYWEIPFTTLLDPEFHAAFEAEFEYRRFSYVFGEE
jgi:hypothetical protein